MIKLILCCIVLYSSNIFAETIFDLNSGSVKIQGSTKAKLLFSSKKRTAFSYIDKKKNKEVIVDIPVRICKNIDGTIQPFRLHKDIFTNSISVIAIGSVVEPGVVLFNASICNFLPPVGPKAGQEIFAYIKGDVEINNSYISGGTIQSSPIIPEEQKDFRTIIVENSELVGNYLIKKKVYLTTVDIKGDPVIEGVDSITGVSITESTLDYENLTEPPKGIYGAVSLHKVTISGNVEIDGNVSVGTHINNTTLKQLNGPLQIKEALNIKDSSIIGSYVLNSGSSVLSIFSSELLGQGKLLNETTMWSVRALEGSVLSTGDGFYLISSTVFEGINIFEGNGDISGSTIKGNNRFQTAGVHGSTIDSDPIIENRFMGAIITGSELYGFFNLQGFMEIDSSSFHGSTVISSGAEINNLKSNVSLDLSGSSKFIENVTISNAFTWNGGGRIIDLLIDGTTNIQGDGDITNADLSGVNSLNGTFRLNPFSDRPRANYANLSTYNFSTSRLLLDSVNWSGTLKLYGPVYLGNVNIGSDVAIQAWNPDGGSTLTIVHSSIGSGLSISENGLFSECVFSGSGPNYTVDCTGKENLQ